MQPKAAFDDNIAVIPGIDGRKMSKSYGNVIPMFEDDKTLKRQCFRLRPTLSRLKSRKSRRGLVYEIYKAVAPADKVQEMAEGLKTVSLDTDTLKYAVGSHY